MKRTYTDQGATFSEFRVFRWTLWRTWADGPTVLWVMLNPSTADELILDPTIRRCEDFSRTWGYRRLVVCNLFAFRSTNPNALYRMVRQGGDPVGYHNDVAIGAEADQADLIVTAWGRHGRLLHRGAHVLTTLHASYGAKLRHLGLNRDGTPRHPLYLSAQTKPTTWPMTG